MLVRLGGLHDPPGPVGGGLGRHWLGQEGVDTRSKRGVHGRRVPVCLLLEVVVGGAEGDHDAEVGACFCVWGLFSIRNGQDGVYGVKSGQVCQIHAVLSHTCTNCSILPFLKFQGRIASLKQNCSFPRQNVAITSCKTKIVCHDRKAEVVVFRSVFCHDGLDLLRQLFRANRSILIELSNVIRRRKAAKCLQKRSLGVSEAFAMISRR